MNTKKIYFSLQFKSMACQACQKPLHRCSICSLYMTIDPPKSAFDEKKGFNKSNSKLNQKAFYLIFIFLF